jgi:hypothetical protein
MELSAELQMTNDTQEENPASNYYVNRSSSWARYGDREERLPPLKISLSSPKLG